MTFDPQSIGAFPTEPGVYVMRNAAGEVVYVGKAANLRSRVRSYFGKAADNRFVVKFLVRQVASIDTVVTATEKDAFLLENTLIKKHRPRYNVQLRDDKTYISLRFRMDHEYPRLELVRVRGLAGLAAGRTAVGSGALLDTQTESDGANADPQSGGRRKKDNDLYFGPYTSSGAVRETLKFLLKVFPVRTCRDSVFNNRTRPCILFDVGKCCGPCTESVPKEDYMELVRKISAFLRGKADDVRDLLQARMAELSERMEYEKAAAVRDRLFALDRTLERQEAASHEGGDRDVIAIASRQGRSLVVLQSFRRGTLIQNREFYLKNYEQEDPEVLYSFLSQHYDGLASEIPHEILVSTEPTDRDLLEDWMRDQRQGAVSLHLPQRGKLAGISHTATQNARIALNRRLQGERADDETLTELSRRLDLEREPRTIECLDISNIMGVLAVGSIVRFEDGKPDKSGYRLFRIRTVQGSDDFGMIREVMMRRFRPGAEKARPFPELFIVDGGKGQLGVAESVFRELDIKDVSLAGMAKSRLKMRAEKPRFITTRKSAGKLPLTDASRKATNTFFPDAPNYTGAPQADETPRPIATPGAPEVVRFRTEERIFLPGRKNPVTFPTNSPALFLLERIRDETHRTAITYHRKLRQKTNRRSVLDEIPGIGPKRKKVLLRHFGSLAAIKIASASELEAVAGVGREAAEAVYRFLHPPADASAVPEVAEVEADEAESAEEALPPENAGENEHLAFAEGD